MNGLGIIIVDCHFRYTKYMRKTFGLVRGQYMQEIVQMILEEMI
jgi:hypothetical protein